MSGAPNPETPPATLSTEVFRTYDIRGPAEQLLAANGGHWLGRAIAAAAREAGADAMVVARDGRLSGPVFAAQVVEGLRAGGLDVVDMGEAPTPLLWYGAWRLAGGCGVMVTASHNPAADNGLKIAINRHTLYGDAIADLHRRLEAGLPPPAEPGGYRETRIDGEYCHWVAEDITLQRPLHVVIDAGNGIAGPLAVRLFEALGCRVTPLYCDVDGHFPNHHPDPSRPENMRTLRETVSAEGADLGIAFDGDGDRLGVVSAAGELIWPDRVLGLFLGEVLGCAPGAAVVFDVKSTRQLFRGVRQYGGRPVMAPSGHSVIKARMAEENAVLGAEMTGHFFFADRWYGFDDALYAAARLAAVVARTPGSNPFLALAGGIATPEIHLPLPRVEALALVAGLAAHPFPGDWERITVDGLRLDAPGGWALIRVSNTRDALVMRFEADNEAALATLQGPLREALTAALPHGTPVPF